MTIPYGWRETLRWAKTVHREAVIGGGALRDLINGKPVKDVDIFVAGMPDVAKIGEAIGREGSLGLFSGDNDYDLPNGSIVGLANFGDYQFIGLPGEVSLETVVDRIDFGGCRVAYDGDYFLIPETFIEDHERKRFTLLRCNSETQRDASVRRYKRFTEKYPDYTFVDGTF